MAPPGSHENWAWDFDSDGSIDSTEANPAMVYAEPGSYTVSLTVSGPDGQDTRIAVGFIEVFLPFLQGIRVLPDRTVEMELSAQAGRSYEIQASENLTGWTTLMSLTPTNDVTTFRDTSAGGLQQRFYRAVVP
jgi:PKD repeat protein